jgi:hypothetical protein
VIEEQLADRFRAAVADEPPMGFDPDDLVDRAARTHRRRSAVLAASAAAALVVLATVAVIQIVRADDQAGGFGSPATQPTKPACPTATDDPIKTKPELTKPIETKPAPSGKRSAEPTVSKTPEPPGKPDKTQPTPPPSCEVKPSGTVPEGSEPFTGWEQAMQLVEREAALVLRERVPGLAFTPVNWTPDAGRCLAGAYQVGNDGYRVVALTVCHNQKSGLDLTPLDGDWGAPVSDTAGRDGSHVVVYRYASDDAGGLSVRHHRTDGVIVQASTSFKSAHGQNGPLLSQEQLTAIATDGRLSF